MHLDYLLYDAGWAEGRVAANGDTIRMTASYLHHSLQELANAVLQLRAGATGASVVFMAEPGEHHLLFSRGEGEQVTAVVRWYADWASWGCQSPDEYETCLETTTTVTELTDQALHLLNTILQTFGPEGYREKWIEDDFPMEEFTQLQQAVHHGLPLP
jgi:hypothetical protein